MRRGGEAEVGPPGKGGDRPRRKEQQVLPGLEVDREALRPYAQPAAGDVGRDRADRRQHHHREADVARDVEERQREDVEGDVVAEQRIRLAERRRFQEAEDRQPLAGGDDAEEEREQRRGGDGHEPEVARIEHDRLQIASSGEHDVGLGEPPHGHAQVAEQEEERRQEHRGADQALGRQRLQEHALVAGLAEPEPLRVELGERRERHDEQQRDQCVRESDGHRVASSSEGCRPHTTA